MWEDAGRPLLQDERVDGVFEELSNQSTGTFEGDRLSFSLFWGHGPATVHCSDATL